MKKIMFNDKIGFLTAAVIDGRKTMTRRLCPIVITPNRIEDVLLHHTHHYHVGEELAVAQSYRDIEPTAKLFMYLSKRYPGRLTIEVPGWNNKMFTEAKFMPHRLRITDVRVEHLQDISDEDCLKEGVVDYSKYPQLDIPDKFGYRVEKIGKDQRMLFDTPREAFISLINKVSPMFIHEPTGRRVTAWDANPFVYVYSFELIK